VPIRQTTTAKLGRQRIEGSQYAYPRLPRVTRLVFSALELKRRYEAVA
jgi:hypothetical protein